MDPLGKAVGIGEVQVCIRLAAVTVAAGDQNLLPARSQLCNLAIFFPAPQAVQLECVQVAVVEGEKVFEILRKFGGQDSVEIP